ncbi:hypothetical protein GUJ93_ZPchr0006g40631 [Zizania palustris]|uniref:Uncharacterized protein n=1 Tax=Zizania palustris TaxID=103762 RepID=A0A8J5T6L7_ZIZPA|nr:hypothetical protein GUJ93_ZPchr0006g40631 [Zizania palustris]
MAAEKKLWTCRRAPAAGRWPRRHRRPRREAVTPTDGRAQRRFSLLSNLNLNDSRHLTAFRPRSLPAAGAPPSRDESFSGTAEEADPPAFVLLYLPPPDFCKARVKESPT